ncbi:MAG: HAD-IB family hydrolase [Eubacteriales bacterium]|nr:HAD-IB family hydrolase [Eubacteriales bacterium]
MVKRALALFDFDGTMAAGDSIVPYIKRAFIKGLIPWYMLPKIAFSAVAGLIKIVPHKTAKSWSLSFLAKLSQEQKEILAKEFIEQELLGSIYPKALEHIFMHQSRGDAVIIVSASPDCYMKYLSNYLPLDAVLASKTTDKGKVLYNLKGEEKPKKIKEWLEANNTEPDWENSFAYGDSDHDSPMMDMVKNPVMVNPKPALQKKRPDWRLEKWEA